MIPPPEWREGIELVWSSPLVAGGSLGLCVVTTGRCFGCLLWVMLDADCHCSVALLMLEFFGDSATKCRSLSRGYIDINIILRYHIIERLILLVWIHN